MSSLHAETAALSRMADRMAAVRRKICAAASRAREAERETRRKYPQFYGPGFLDIESAPRFTRLGNTDSWYWHNKKRMVSGEERQRILNEFYKKQARQLLGGD